MNKENYVTISLPRANPGEENYIYVAVNGRAYQLPKGKSSTVPAYIAKEVLRAEEAREKLEAYIASASKQ